MFNTHYARLFIKEGRTLTSANDSIVFKAIPQGKLVCADDIVRNCMGDKENGGLIKNLKDVEGVLKGLIENKWVAEVHGIRIEKFLKTL